MLLQIDKLGKVAVTVEENYWSLEKDYDKLTIVQKADEFATYISRKPVPAGTVLTDRNYWIPFSSLKEDIVINFNKFIADLTAAMEDTKEYTNGVISNGVSDINAIKQEAISIITYIAKNGIDSSVLAPSSITNEKIQDGAVTNSKIADNSIDAAKLGTGTIDGSKLKENSIPGSKLADGAIDAEDIQDNTLSGTKLIDNSVPGSKLVDNAITSEKIKNNSIDGNKIADSTIQSLDIKDGTISGTKLMNSSIIGDKLADGSVDNNKIVNNTITSSKIEDGAITTDKLANSSIGSASIADNAITNNKLQDNSIINRNIATGTITGDKFVDNTITGDKIVDNTIEGSKIKDGTIENVDIKDNTLSGAKLVDNSISGSKIADNAITSAHLLDNSIPASKIKDGTIESIDIKDGTLDGSKVKDNTITSAKLADNAVTTDKLVNNSITENKIGTGAVTEDKIDSSAVTNTKIANNAVTTSKIDDSAVTEDKLANGAITSDKIADDTITELQTIMDEVPTKDSVKPVQSGGVQNELALGAVYDISAKNPTAGPNNDGKWESLSTLLSDASLNTIIPTAVRKGGMSVKFVQSSDNKYVQYRLMSDSFSKIPVNWQGVDDVPTAGSDNLIKSGGVKKITSERVLGLNSRDFVEKGYYSKDTGLFVANTNNRSVKMTIPSDAKYLNIVNYRDSSNFEGVVFYDSSDNFIEAFGISTAWKRITIQPNYSKVAINAVYSTSNITLKCIFTSSPFFTASEIDAIENIEVNTTFSTGEKVRNIGLESVPTVGSSGLVRSGGVKSLLLDRNSGLTSRDLTRGGYYAKTTGEYVSNNNLCSAKIDIPSDVKYIEVWNYRNASSYECIVFYDSNDNYIEGFSFSDSWTRYPIKSTYSKVAISGIYSDTNILLLCLFSNTPLFTNKDIKDINDINQIIQQLLSEDVYFSSGEKVSTVSIADEVSENNSGLSKSKDVYNFGRSLVIRKITEQDISYTQTSYNPPFESCVLKKGVQYEITVSATGDQLVRFKTIAFYSSTSSSSLVFSETLPTGGLKSPVTFKVIFDSNVNYIKTSAISLWTGEAQIHVVATCEEPIYSTTDGTNDIISNNKRSEKRLPLNIFGDILPLPFKEKLISATDDLLIVCQGDSLTGLTQKCEPATEPSHEKPCGLYKHFVSLLQDEVSKVHPYYNRLDSVRNDVEFYTKAGTWEEATTDTFSPSGSPIISDNSKESSVTAFTYRSNSDGASVSFAFDADTYEKCNILFSKNSDAGEMRITIAGGDGLMLASIDRVNWVEANGFTHSQASIAATATNGEAVCQRHRRVWMKKTNSATGSISISYTKTTNDGKYVYFWGTEMYSGRAILFDNIGRGGRTSSLLSYNISDVFDRNPDLTIFEMPLANDLYHGTTWEDLIVGYNMYFVEDGSGRNYKYRSNNYANYPVIILLPHGRAVFFDESDNAVMGSSSVQTIRISPAYCLYKRVFGYLYNNLKTYPNVTFVNIYDQYLNEAKDRWGSWHEGMTSGNLTADGTHLNQNGANIYSKYLAPLFNVDGVSVSEND